MDALDAQHLAVYCVMTGELSNRMTSKHTATDADWGKTGRAEAQSLDTVPGTSLSIVLGYCPGVRVSRESEALGPTFRCNTSGGPPLFWSILDTDHHDTVKSVSPT